MLSIPLLIGVIVITALVWFWQDSLSTRERANFAAQAACERLSLQFLDGTVAFARLSLVRGDHGRLSLRRTYLFDYTVGSIERLQGFVVLIGHRMEAIGFAADNAAHSNADIGSNSGRAVSSLATSQTTSMPTHQASDAPPDNVLDLNEWRKRHQPTALPSDKQTSDNWP